MTPLSLHRCRGHHNSFALPKPEYENPCRSDLTYFVHCCVPGSRCLHSDLNACLTNVWMCESRTMGSCQINSPGANGCILENLGKGSRNASISFVWIRRSAALCPVGTGNLRRSKKGVVPIQSRSLSSADRNGFYEIISDADTQVCSVHLRH